MMRVLDYGDGALHGWSDRTPSFDQSLTATVARTIEEVAKRGAVAVLEHTRRFDSPGLQSLFVGEPERAQANPDKSEHTTAIQAAISRVEEFHQVQLDTITEGWTPTGDGWGWRMFSNDERESGMVGQRMLPIASAGIYVPGGQADYPSSVIMNVVPARVAGVKRIVVATPPDRQGNVPPAVLFACRELGVETVLKAGGASAIAAMALGIEDMERVDVIAGPGNKYVNEAKRQLWGTVGLDSYAGPSEVCVVVDESANAKFAAADLIAQVEHAEDNVAVLVALSRKKCDEVLSEVELQALRAPRETTIRAALRDHGVAVVCANMTEAVEVVNRFAPEHLALHVEVPAEWLPGIRNAGAIMMGPWTAQSVGDYCEGPSHTLPTSGAARFASPVSVATFLKSQTVSMLEDEDARDLAPFAQAFAEMEGLPAHGAAASVRVDPLLDTWEQTDP